MTAGPRGVALVRDLVRRANDPVDPLSSIDALELVTPADLLLILHPGGPTAGARVVATGVGASPGVAVGVAVFDTIRALYRADRGEPFVLVRDATAPADEPALVLAAGVVTSTGGLASHAAVLARGRGLPAVCGAESLRIGADRFTAADGTVVREGDPITIDGGRGEVSIGGDPGPAAGDRSAGLPPELDELLGWADEVRAGSLAVLANADTAEDARRALRLGAEGIGLCRVEHLLLAADGLAALRRAIALPDRAGGGADALQEVQAQLRDGFESLLEVMDGRTVSVRLLDLPRHELGHEPTDPTDLADEEHASSPVEQNPMMGERGVRMAVLQPELYRTQVRALGEAVSARRQAGGRPIARILVPFVSVAAELLYARELIETTLTGSARSEVIPVGVMVETPRAALRCGDLAGIADFVSFGTNDLTQLTLGLSRDDSSRVLDRYLGAGLLGADPFGTIDVDGVGELVRSAVDRARDVDPSIEVGVCGEHGGDPRSIAFLVAAGVDQVSCSPFRVPVARLAAARTVLGVGGAPDAG